MPKTNHSRGFVAKFRDWSGPRSFRHFQRRLPSGARPVQAFGGDCSYNGHRGDARSLRGAKRHVNRAVRRDARRHIQDQLEA